MFNSEGGRLFFFMDASKGFSSRFEKRNSDDTGEVKTMFNLCNIHGFEADLICVSLYKILGFPTGVGALIVKHEASPYFV